MTFDLVLLLIKNLGYMKFLMSQNKTAQFAAQTVSSQLSLYIKTMKNSR